MPDNINKKIKALPARVKNILLARHGVEIMKVISDKYYFSIIDTSALVKIIAQVFVKDLTLDQMQAAIAKTVDVEEDQLQALLIDVLSGRMLVADDYFEGQVTAMLTQLKVDPVQFEPALKKYRLAVRKEFFKPKVKKAAAAPEKERNIVEERIPELKVGEPESELREMAKLLKGHAIFTSTTDELLFRVDANIIIITLLQTGKEVQQELLKALLNNQEKIGAKKIAHKGEKLKPTIANWLKDYISTLPFKENEKLSTLQKAKYYSESPNVKQLSEEEKDLLDRIFDTYENIRNFYFDLDKIPLSEIQIFPFTEAEQDKFFEQYGQGTEERSEDKQNKKQSDKADPMKGNEQEAEAVNEYKSQLIDKTHKDRKRLSDQVFKDILTRKKIEIIAGLKLLAETGLLDNIVTEDKRFRELLMAYFKRNDMIEQLKSFEAEAPDPTYVKHFIKYILAERLGMTENMSGRWAMQFSNIFRAQGKKQLSQMAYYDMQNEEFKWL